MPSTPTERRALAVIAAIAALGVVARVVKSRHARPAPTAAEVLALDQQIARVREARTGSRSGGGRPKTARRATSAESTRNQPTSRPKREVVPPPLVDLDTASAAIIEALPWIGPSLAARIVESRDKCGPFGSMEELTRVYGIGEGMAKRLAPHVTFSTSSRPMDADRTPQCPGPVKGAAPRRRGRS
jgi:DNA uptake protein ComE-like DNA-binding protein